MPKDPQGAVYSFLPSALCGSYLIPMRKVLFLIIALIIFIFGLTFIGNRVFAAEIGLWGTSGKGIGSTFVPMYYGGADISGVNILNHNYYKNLLVNRIKVVTANTPEGWVSTSTANYVRPNNLVMSIYENGSEIAISQIVQYPQNYDEGSELFFDFSTPFVLDKTGSYTFAFHSDTPNAAFRLRTNTMPVYGANFTENSYPEVVLYGDDSMNAVPLFNSDISDYVQYKQNYAGPLRITFGPDSGSTFYQTSNFTNNSSCTSYGTNCDLREVYMNLAPVDGYSLADFVYMGVNNVTWSDPVAWHGAGIYHFVFPAGTKVNNQFSYTLKTHVGYAQNYGWSNQWYEAGWQFRTDFAGIGYSDSAFVDTDSYSNSSSTNSSIKVFVDRVLGTDYVDPDVNPSEFSNALIDLEGIQPSSTYKLRVHYWSPDLLYMDHDFYELQTFTEPYGWDHAYSINVPYTHTLLPATSTLGVTWYVTAEVYTLTNDLLATSLQRKLRVFDSATSTDNCINDPLCSSHNTSSTVAGSSGSWSCKVAFIDIDPCARIKDWFTPSGTAGSLMSEFKKVFDTKFPFSMLATVSQFASTTQTYVNSSSSEFQTLYIDTTSTSIPMRFEFISETGMKKYIPPDVISFLRTVLKFSLLLSWISYLIWRTTGFIEHHQKAGLN